MDAGIIKRLAKKERRGHDPLPQIKEVIQNDKERNRKKH